MKKIVLTICGMAICLFLSGCDENKLIRSKDGVQVGIKWTEYDNEYIIPDLNKWSQITNGMSETELIQLLGEPINRINPTTEYEPDHLYPLYYGYTSKRSDIFALDLDLKVFIKMGKVAHVEDWFGGVEISRDGLPTIPKLLKPANNIILNHYPRVVDFRWYVASGVYPMRYEVNVDTYYYSSEQWSYANSFKSVKEPYYSYIHAGKNKGRWRVRAINEKGTSEWSEFQYFTFTH